MLFRWVFPSFHFLIYNINSASSPTLMYSNIFLFANFSFHLLVYNLNITFSPTLTYSNIFLFANACFGIMWYLRIKILIGGVICYLTCSGYFIHKTGFFGEVLDVFSFLLFLNFFLCSVFQFPLHSVSSIYLSWSHLSKVIFHVNIIHLDYWTSVSWYQIIFSYTLFHHNFKPQCHICSD